MKTVRLFFLTCLALMIVVPSWADTIEKVPVITVEKPIFTFPEVLDGEKIIHDFIVKNKGDAILKIDHVDTTWGCTAASFDKTILPGGQGKVTIHLKTKNKGGHILSKTIKIRSNDKVTPILPLTIKGNVKKFADMSSSYISFRGTVGSKLERKLTITPKKEYPFKIENVKVRKKQKLDVVWKEVKTDTGVKYEFLIKNIQEEPGSCKNMISVNIDSDIKDQLVIQVGGYLSAQKKNKVKNK